jgi:hypothetical protein
MTITPQQVSQSLVHSDVGTQMGTRLQEMETEILSRSSLSDLIVHLDLYKKERTQKPLEDIVQDMRNKAIQVKPYESTGAGRRKPGAGLHHLFQLHGPLQGPAGGA